MIDEDIDITIDSFDLFLPEEASYADPNALCQELVLNGDAEANGFHPYPMYNSRYNQQVTKEEENGNKFWRLFNRNYYRSSLKYRLNDICLTQGVTYLFSSKLRFHQSKDFVGGSEPYTWFIYFRRADGSGWTEENIVHCDAQSANDGWVTCSGEFMVEKNMAESKELYLEMKIENSRDGDKYDLDFDDISIRYHKGYVNELVVDKEDVSCWGNEADVHITTSTYFTSNGNRKPAGMQFNISDIVDNSDGTVTLLLNESTTLPLISADENSDYAAEIALISRNMIIKGEEGEDNKGGYMQVIHTPNITQKIQGIEFQNMGRRGEADRFVSVFILLFANDVFVEQLGLRSFANFNLQFIIFTEVNFTC